MSVRKVVEMKELAPGIVVFENVFPNSMEYITRIEEQGISWRPAEVLVNENEHQSGTNIKARDTDFIMLPHHESSETGTRGTFTIPDSIASISEKSEITHGKSVPSG